MSDDSSASMLQYGSLRDYHNKANTIPLPNITLAMNPDKVCFHDDISDKEQFNDRFIESRVHEGMAAFILYLAAMMHNVILLTIIATCTYEIINGELKVVKFIILSAIMYSVVSFWSYIAFKIASPYPIRFNRQAQMVHYPVSDTEVISLPWREAIPFTRLSRTATGSHNLMLVFPNPNNPGVPDNPNVLETSVGFDSIDFSSAHANYERLEFIRRYMESGLNEIQPCQALIDTGHVRKPTGYEVPRKFKDGPIFFIIYESVKHIFYWLGTGPLVDRWIRNKVRNYKWPEEVERLCAKGADLSGIDNTPVKSQTDIFYEFDEINKLSYVDKYRQKAR